MTPDPNKRPNNGEAWPDTEYGEPGRIWPDSEFQTFEKAKGAEHRQCCLLMLGCLCVQAGVVWLLCWLVWGRGR